MKALLALALLSGAALPAQAAIANWSKAARVDIVMTDRGYAPPHVSLRAGRPYVLRFVNRGTRGHDFNAKGFFGQARVEPADGYRIRRNQIDLDPGRSATVRLIAPTTPGAQYGFESKSLGDAASGYKGDIFVR